MPSKPPKLDVGVRYIVTKTRYSDGTLQVDDHIQLQPNGDLMVREAHGWLDAKHVAEAMRGVEVEIDREWVEKRKAALLAELKELEVLK